MHFSTQINFSRSFGKTIGKTIEQNKFNDIKEIILNDLFLCKWIYYEDFDRFIEEFKVYLTNLSKSEDDGDKYIYDLSKDSHLKNILEIFWLESNDSELRKNYDQTEALEDYCNKVNQNGYTIDIEKEIKIDGFYLFVRLLNYKNNNIKLGKLLLDLTNNLYNTRIDDIIKTRTKDEWENLYSLRFLYKKVVNDILENKSEDCKLKMKIERYLMYFQETSESLEWHNPYSKKIIESIEYFPRESSKPEHDYAYASHYDFENNAQNIVDKLYMKTQQRQEQRNIYIKNLENELDKIEYNNKKTLFINKNKNLIIGSCFVLLVVSIILFLIY